MTSTRNINSSSDYCLQQASFRGMVRYMFYEHSQYGTCLDPAIPCVGYTPSHLPRDVLSHNPIEIESALFGINSSNLVSPQKPVQPYLKKLPSKQFFQRAPLIMPSPLIMENNQRPFPVPN